MSFYDLSNIYIQPTCSNFDLELVHNLLKNYAEIPNLNLEELAEICFVSPSALRKFIKRLNLGSYTEFKIRTMNFIDESEIYGSKMSPNNLYVENTLSDLRKNLDLLSADLSEKSTDIVIDAVAKDLLSAKMVKIFSNSATIGQVMLMKSLFLNKIDVQCYVLPKTYWDVANLIDDNSMILFLCPFLPSSHFSISQVEDAASRGSKTVVISSTEIFGSQNVPDYNITFRTCTLNNKSYFSFMALDLVLQMIRAAIEKTPATWRSKRICQKQLAISIKTVRFVQLLFNWTYYFLNRFAFRL